MDLEIVPAVALLAGGGFIGGLALLVRGMGGYRTASRIADTSTSRIGSIAAGEVRLAGVIEPAELILVSLLQSVPCVYYRSTVDDTDDDLTRGDGHTEERAVGFRLRDTTGTLRIFPRGARIDAPVRFDERTGTLGDEPPGLSMRTGGSVRVGEPDRDAAIADLLRVHDPGPATLRPFSGEAGGRHRYREARLEPGDAITVVGRALPFGDLPDPAGADVGTGNDAADGSDPEVAADLAAAEATGTLVADPQVAWGNAAIPGFGIGRPIRAARIDPAANPLPLAGPRGGGPDRADLRDRSGDARRGRLGRGPVAHRARDAGRGDRTPAGPVPHRTGRRDRVGHLGHGVRGDAQWRIQLVSPPEYAATFAVGLVALIVGFMVVSTYNAVVALRQRIDKAWSNIDVVLKQRHDQLPALVSAVRGLMTFEQDVLTEVTRARAAYAPSQPIPTQAGVSEQTSSALRTLFATVERYPEIKSAANVSDLQEEIERLEAMIADRRELYNDQVYRYNTRIAQFPVNALAWFLRWRPRDFFAVEPGETARPDSSLDRVATRD